MKKIKAFIAGIIKKVSNLFARISPEVKESIHLGVVVTENIKRFVDSGLSDVLTAIIPGEIDNLVKDKLRAYLPMILAQLRLIDAATHATSQDELVKHAILELQMLDSTVKPGFLNNLSILIAQVTSDGKLSWDDAAYLVKWYYDNKYKKD